jgi:hypothetical protein
MLTRQNIRQAIASLRFLRRKPLKAAAWPEPSMNRAVHQISVGIQLLAAAFDTSTTPGRLHRQFRQLRLRQAAAYGQIEYRQAQAV